LPFLCQYVYPPCDGNGSAKFITQEQCINIRDEVCALEWSIAINTELGNLLPICEEFNVGNDSSLIVRNDAEPRRCHYQFKEFCGVCLPLCGTFSQYRDQVKFGERAIIILSAILALIGGFVVLVAAIMRQSEMLVFPQVLALYTILSAVILGENLYCAKLHSKIDIRMYNVRGVETGF